MKIIKWSFHTGHKHNVNHPDSVKEILDETYNPYVPLSHDVIKERKGVVFTKCPAVTDFMKSTYVFKSPIDLNFDLEITDTSCKVYCENISQDIFDSIVDVGFLDQQERGESKYPLIGIDLFNTFTCDSSVMLQVLPAFMHYNDFTTKTTVIPGEYDISKWVRPVELVFEVRNRTEQISIKKGDALSYFKFISNDSIKLENSATPWEEISICNDLRNANTFKPLKERYRSYKEYKDGKD